MLKQRAIGYVMVVLAGLALTGCEKKEGDTQAHKAATPAAVDASAAYMDKEHAPVGEGWVSLIQGDGLTGWSYFPVSRANSWKVEHGVLVNVPPGDHQGVNIYTDKDYGDFELYYEYKLAAGSNGGVFLRGIYEIQIVDDIDVPAGDPPKDWGNGGVWSKKPPDENASKPAGEWQSMYIKLAGTTMTAVLNGQTIHKDYELPGPTYLYTDLADRLKVGEPGPIILQGDHGPIEFRHVMIRPLK